MEFIETDIHNNYSTITAIMFDYPCCNHFFLYFNLLYFLVWLFQCCAHASVRFCVLSFLTRLLASERSLNAGGNVAVLDAGWPSNECCEAGMSCVLWQHVSAWLCQVHLDSAPRLSRVIISPESRL